LLALPVFVRSGAAGGYRVCAQAALRSMSCLWRPPSAWGKKQAGILPDVMALNIKDDAADQLARELAAETGESITTAVTVAVRERLERLRGAVPRERRGQVLSRIAKRSATRPVTDLRSAEEILGYGPDGLSS
jgi:antitoxin VapB